MAAAEELHSLQYNLEDSLLQCAICLEPFTVPKILPCVHTFCQACLIQTHENDVSRGAYGNDEIHCPSCRSTHRLPEGGVRELPSDHRMNLLTDLLAQHTLTEHTTESPAKGTLSCSVCKSTGRPVKPTIYCFPCMQPLCSGCAEKHDRKQSYKSHLRAWIEVNASPVLCTRHRGRFVTRYCQTCSMPICEVCAVQDNENHRHSDFVHRKKSKQSKEKSLLDQLSSVKEALCLKKKGVQSAKENNDKMRDNCRQEIEKQSARIALAIKRQEEVLLAYTVKHHAQVEECISEMEHAIEKSLRLVINLEDRMRRHVLPICENEHISHNGDIPLDIQISARKVVVPDNQLDFKYGFTPKKNIVLGKLVAPVLPDKVMDTPVVARKPVPRAVCARDVSAHPQDDNRILCQIIQTSCSGSLRCFNEILKEDRLPRWVASLLLDIEVCRLNVNPRMGSIAVLGRTDGTSIGIVLEHSKSQPVRVEANPRFTQKLLTATDSGEIVALTVDDPPEASLTTLVCYSESGVYKWRKKIASERLDEEQLNMVSDSSNRIIVGRSRRVDIYDHQGDYIQSLPRETHSDWKVGGVCVDREDRILVALGGPVMTVCLFSTEGDFLRLVVPLVEEPIGMCLFQQDKSLVTGSKEMGPQLYKLQS